MVRTVTLMALLWVGMAGWAFSQNYYYGPEGKTFLEVSKEKILLEFQADVDFETQQSLLANFPQVAPLQREMLIPTPVRTLAEVQGVQTEEELRQLLQELQALDAVVHAGAFLAHKDGTLHGIDRSLLVRIQQPGDQALLQNWARQHGAEVEQANEFDLQLFHLRVAADAPVDALQLANILHESGLFDYAEPDFLRLMKRMSTNDPFLGNQWALNNDGNNTSSWGGTPGSDMKVFNAWNTSTGSSSIKVAILDEGVDLNHPDLAGNMLPGYDATGQGSGGAPSGDDAHGTACAGIVAAVGDNNEGVAGVAYSCGIVPVRIAYSSGTSWITYNSWIANSLNWSWQTAGADVLSNSWGGGSSSSAINGAIDGAVNNGRGGLGAPVLFAAGNNNAAVSYPATYEPTIAVIAMSMCDQRKSPSSCDNETWWGSNYGTNADVAAPGVKIYATDISGANGYSNGDYVSNFNGTSSACPNAAGVMALILSVNSNLTEDQARGALESTCDKVGGYSYSTGVSGQPNGSWSTELGHGRVNAEAALLSVAPSSPDDAGISAISSPQGTICSSSATPSVTLRNYGSNTLTSATINYQVDNGTVSTYSWSGNLPSLGTTSVSLPSISFSSGSHTFTAYTSNPNGQSDSNPNNDSSSSNFNSGSNGVTLTIVLDNYPGETTWEIRDASNNLMASGGPYSGAGSTVIETACLADGCFDFTIFDSYGDGICCSWGSGSYALTEDNSGNTLASGGAFGSSETTSFCVSSAPPPLSASISGSSDVSCNGSSDGSATAAASGGSSPYNYSWSNGAGGATASGLSAGSYTVTITDNDGTTATASVTISEPSVLGVSVSGNNPTFGNNDGSATASASGGSPGYTYNWSNGGSGATISGLGAGTYTVTTTDANGCTATGSITLVEIVPQLSVSISSSSDVSCNGGTDGSATASASGGASPYTYAWSSGANGANASGLSAGSYTVTVTDNDGTTATASVTISEPSALSVSVSGNNPTFGNNDGSATASASGGSPGYTYNWSNGGSGASISGLGAGNYTVTVTDANGCTATGSITLVESAPPLSASISSSSDVSCNGGANGSATASASGGSTPYTYAWSNGANGATASGLSAGSYSVTVTDNDGTTATTSVTISEPSAVSVSTSTTNASNGGSDGSATASASGGTPGYTYSWSNGGSGATISGLAPGTYTVTATDANGCTATASAVVNEDPPPGSCTYQVIDSESFETGWGIWIDGGSDCERNNGQNEANTGTFSIRLRDNSNSSVMTTQNLDLSTYEEITVAFSYITTNFNNSNEDFWLQISDNGGSSYTTVKTWAAGVEFQDGVRGYDTIVIQGPFQANSRFRFRCDANNNGDRLYIDDVEISGCGPSGQGGSSELPVAGETGKEKAGSEKGAAFQGLRPPAEEEQELSLLIYPNPTQSMLQVQLDLPEAGPLHLQVLSIQGQPVMQREWELSEGQQQLSLNVEGLPAGQYLLLLRNSQQRTVHPFVIVR